MTDEPNKTAIADVGDDRPVRVDKDGYVIFGSCDASRRRLWQYVKRARLRRILRQLL